MGELATLPDAQAIEVERARVYADAATPDTTARAYASHWRSFEAWCADRAEDPTLAHDAGVAVYLAWMADNGKHPKTVECAFGAIASRLRVALPDIWPAGRRPPACARVLRGIMRTVVRSSAAKRPALAADLQRMIEHCGAGRFAIRNRAILLFGFAGAFRRSELVALSLDDVAFSPSGARAIVRRGKTDQLGKGLEKGITRARGDLCPVAALERWIEEVREWDASGEGQAILAVEGPRPVFRPMSRTGATIEPRALGARTVALVVKEAAAAAGLPSREFGGHSLRSGLVTEAALHHKGLDAIMRQTGHRSVAQVIGYIRHATVFEENASEGILD